MRRVQGNVILENSPCLCVHAMKIGIVKHTSTWPPSNRCSRKFSNVAWLITKLVITNFWISNSKFLTTCARSSTFMKFIAISWICIRRVYTYIRYDFYDLLLAMSPVTGAWKTDPWINEFQDRSRNDTEILITRKMADINKQPLLYLILSCQVIYVRTPYLAGYLRYAIAC